MQDVIIKQNFKVSVEMLWKAVTEHRQMILWFFENIPEFEAHVGFKTQFLIENEGRKFTHLWEIMEVIPNQKIVYNWKYDEYEGEGLVFFELVENEKESSLILINKWIGEFPQDIPEFSRESCLGGWEYFINGRLKEYLSNR
ncbi:MAG: ATPase [Kordia sp.]|nr:MAG: ATPase [Kordia sp.]